MSVKVCVHGKVMLFMEYRYVCTVLKRHALQAHDVMIHVSVLSSHLVLFQVALSESAKGEVRHGLLANGPWGSCCA